MKRLLLTRLPVAVALLACAGCFSLLPVVLGSLCGLGAPDRQYVA